MSKYWLKLWYEILDDRKMGVLSDRLYRRTIELFLLAGELDKDGILPPLEDIAWRLRIPEIELEQDLQDLKNGTGILEQPGDGIWVVKNFQKRQAPPPKREYMRRLRAQDKRDQYYQPVTNSNPDTDTDTDRDKSNRSDQKPVTNSNNLVTGFDTAPAVAAFNSHTATANKLYIEATGQGSIPFAQAETALPMLLDILDHYRDDYQGALDLCKTTFVKWCKTTNKQGKPYGKTNTNWLTWVLEELAPVPAGSKPKAAETKEEEFERRSEAINNLYSDDPQKAQDMIAQVAKELKL